MMVKAHAGISSTKQSRISWKGLFSKSKKGLNVLMITFHVKAMDVIENISAIG